MARLSSMRCLLLALFLVGCARSPDADLGPTSSSGKPQTLLEARAGFKTRLVRQVADGQPVPPPPPNLFQVVRYESPGGKMAAYLSRKPATAEKSPAILWVFGGFGNDIGDPAWKEGPPQNDQSASSYRKSGIVMMYPSFRGGNDNPGFQENFYGEIDDLLAAADYLAKVDYVDPKRIYLGGHSTGGTTVMLAAAAGGERFRAVFAFGPVEDVAGYGSQQQHFFMGDPRELQLRSPARWQNTIPCPTFVFEGTEQGNIDSLRGLQRASTNTNLHFHPVPGQTHFSLLRPINQMIASRILQDTGATCNITFKDDELSNLPKR